MSEPGEGTRPPIETEETLVTDEAPPVTLSAEDTARERRLVLWQHEFEHLLPDDDPNSPPPHPDMTPEDWTEIKRRGNPSPLEEHSDDTGATAEAAPAKPRLWSRIRQHLSKRDNEEHGTPEQRARQEIEYLSGKRGFGRELTPDEQAIIEAKYLDQENLNRIDQETTVLYKKFDNLTKPSKLKTIIRNIAISTAAGTVIRTGLHLAGMGFGAGAVTGSLVGLGYGYFIRGINTGERQVYGAAGYLGEYEKIVKQEGQSSPLEYRQQGLAFLREVLSNPKNFRGNHNELLQVLGRYRHDATALLQEQHRDNISERTEDTPARQLIRIGDKQMAVDDETIGIFLQTITSQESKGKQLVDGYRHDPTVLATIGDARKKAALRGLIVGGVVGAASDLVGLWMHSLAQHKAQAAQEIAENKAAGAYQEAYKGAMGDQSQYHPGEFNYLEENPLEHVQPGQFEHAIGLDTAQATQYGNALSHALRENYITTHHFTLPDGMTPQQMNDLVHASNFAHSNPALNADVAHGEYYHFDDQTLREYVNRAYELMKVDDQPGLIDLISGAEETIHHEAVQAGLDAANATNAGVETAKTAVEKAGQMGWGEAALHGAAIGGITGAAMEASKQPEFSVEHHPVTTPDKQAQQETKTKTGTSDNLDLSKEAISSEPDPARQHDRIEVKVDEENPPPTPEPTTEPSSEAAEINWGEVSDEELEAKANSALTPLGEKKFSDLTETEQKTILELLDHLGKKTKIFNISIVAGSDTTPRGYAGYLSDEHKLILGRPGNRLSSLSLDAAPVNINFKLNKQRGGRPR